MLFYLSVLSAYLKKKKTGLPKLAGGYDLIFKNTDMRKRTRLSFFPVVFEMVVFFCCSDYFVHCLALVLDLAVALTRPTRLSFFFFFFPGEKKKTSDRCREPLGGGETVQ